MYSVHDWAEVRRLRKAGSSKAAIARQLGMSRNTVTRLLQLKEPPRYDRRAAGSLVDPFKDCIAKMLDDDAEVPATVIFNAIRAEGYEGKLTILKDYVREVRWQFKAARAYQRTTYLPGELGHFDWWHLPITIAVGKERYRSAHGLVATLPHSAAHAVFFTLGKTTADFCPALVGALQLLGGVPQAAVVDNDSSIVATGCGRRARLHDEVVALFGHLGIKPIVLEPRRPESKGQGERTIGYLESSFLPLRSFAGIDDLQGQHDAWARAVAYQRHHRRVGAKVVDAWNVERGFLSSLPDPLPDTDRRFEVRVQKDGFVRVGDVDYSVPPGLGSRRVQVRSSLTEVVVYLEGKEIARHSRSYVPADVVLDPAHARALRLARDAKQRLRRQDVDVSVPDLSVYDDLVGSP